MGYVSVTIKYFALLREQSGISEEKLNVEQDSVQKIYSLLADKYGFTLPLNRIKAAVNDQFCEMDYVAKDGDKIVFIPPVAGG